MPAPSTKRPVITTGQAANFCHVSISLMSKWIDAGLIDHFRLPPTNGRAGHRRIHADALAAFMARAGMRVPADLATLVRPSVLVCGMPAHEYDRLAGELREFGYPCEPASTWPEAVLSIHRCVPALFVATATMGRPDCWDWAGTISAAAPGCRLIYVAGDDEVEPHLFERRGYEVIRTPLTAASLGIGER